MTKRNNLIVIVVCAAIIFAMTFVSGHHIKKDTEIISEAESVSFETFSFVMSGIFETETEIQTETNEETTLKILKETCKSVQEEPVIFDKPSPEEYVGNDYTFFVTGYTAEEGFEEGDIGASGYPVGPGVCAMIYSQMLSLGLNWGDVIKIDGLGTYMIADTGYDWGVIDVWFYTNAEAYQVTDYYAVHF